MRSRRRSWSWRRKASTIRNRRVLSGWLHEIAYRIAIKARASGVRRRNLEREGMAMSRPTADPGDQTEQAAWNELRPVLHEEVNRLPDKYRIPVILSYLEGKTNEEVAEQLRWPVGTVKGRLSRARDLLRSRLTRRGLALSAAFLMTALSRGRVFAESVPADLVRRTVRLAISKGPVIGGRRDRFIATLRPGVDGRRPLRFDPADDPGRPRISDRDQAHPDRVAVPRHLVLAGDRDLHGRAQE